MYIFNSDLDNTLVYSYKHNIGDDKINVEIYHDREISYITKRTSRLLNNVIKKLFLCQLQQGQWNNIKGLI